jgi:hypothetical protein
MTKAQDIREAIAENSVTPGERRALEALADGLEETLSEAVPYRSEFKADLRRRLVAEARRHTARAWYRRPAVWGSTFATAAAAAILVIGLQVVNRVDPTPGPASPEVAQAPPAQPGSNQPLAIRQVSHISLPVVDLAPDILPAGHPAPESIAAVADAREMNVYLASGRPDQAQFSRMAQGLGMTAQPRSTGAGFDLAEGARSLRMTPDGHVTYEDRTAVTPGAHPVTAETARAAGDSFLRNAALPIPTVSPTLMVNNQGQWRVAYTQRVDERPIVNAQTVILISPDGRVSHADAYVQQTYQATGPYAVRTAQDALAQARTASDATYDGVDLVYVRTLDKATVYLQPYWRVYGTTGQGARLVRYVPALIPETK